MHHEPFFGASPYYVAMATVGAGIILAYWLPRFFSGGAARGQVPVPVPFFRVTVATDRRFSRPSSTTS